MMEQKKDLTSQRETLINSLISEMKKESDTARVQNMTGRFHIKLSWDEFLQLFCTSAATVLNKRGCYWDFTVDESNTPVLQQLYLYLTLNPNFGGDLHKGLMLQGAIGCGKSLIMESYAHLQNSLIQKFSMRFGLATFVSSQELISRLKTEEVKAYSKRPLIIDELGREPKQVMNYGNITTPIVDLLCARADKAVITHGTTNFKFSSLASEEFYGAMVGDRLKAMFNFITLAGESRRK